MISQKLQLKIFLTEDSARTAEPDAFVRIFHRWLKERRLPELLIDVASYTHVPDGPGVVMIGHGSDYALDFGGGRAGLLHNRKRAGVPPDARLEDLARRTLHVANLLQQDPLLAGKVQFASDELLFRINDRLAAPNDDDSFAAVKQELVSLGERLFAAGCSLTRVTDDPKGLFAVRMRGASRPALAELLARAGGPPAADSSLVT